MKLFTDATIKLASWYLIILMTVSLLFSLIIFQVARSEIATRLETIAQQRQQLGIDDSLINISYREQLDTATSSLVVSLGYLNLVVLLAGGAGTYFLARQTLKPIEAAHDAQSRFVANASHQFRTPLAIMKAETELALADRSTKKQDLRHTLTSNLEEINHLTDLSSMLLDLSRSERAFGQTTDQVDLVKIIDQTIESLGIASRVSVNAPASLTTYTYETAAREVCFILLDNAVKHGHPTDGIKVELSESKSSVTLQITNHGKVIPAKQLSHAFERFYSSQNQNGYGLGLPLAKQLVKALGGTISLASSAKTGTVATVVLSKK